MITHTEPPGATEESVAVPASDAFRFARQLVHDVRNALNALDLQLSAVQDEASGANKQVMDDVADARRIVKDEARRLMRLSTQLRGPSPEKANFSLSSLMKDLQSRVERLLGKKAKAIDWHIDVD